ncbi:MAG: methyltransferase domain-containing protein [Methylacidiphilales bacterium]|nr:methyltransferase domain-containing protein [Candidatus Methylacidiphilales bacterium]MDW8350193.1 methyltransferase domain-containing protein [Verrucomicrobiae bacterium]
MPKPYQPVVSDLLNQWRPATILDAPSGSGWLKDALHYKCKLDGIDLFTPPHTHTATDISQTYSATYHTFLCADLDLGIPEDLPLYEAIVSCEGIEHLGNPNLFFKTAYSHLVPGGKLIVTTPNIWYPESRLKFFLRGFFPSFPCLTGRIATGTHMHIMPWSFPQLYLYMRLNGFTNIVLHNVSEPKPKRFYERLIGFPLVLYCRRKQAQSRTEEERVFWSQAGTSQSTYGRRLVVSAERPLSS